MPVPASAGARCHRCSVLGIQGLGRRQELAAPRGLERPQPGGGGVTGLPRGGLRVPSPEARMKAFVLLCVQRDDSPRGCSCGGECCQGRGHCRATPPPQAPPTPTACNADGDGDEPQAGRFPSGCFLKYVATRGMSLSHTSGAPTSRNHWPFLGRQERTPLGRLPAKRQRPGK